MVFRNGIPGQNPGELPYHVVIGIPILTNVLMEFQFQIPKIFGAPLALDEVAGGGVDGVSKEGEGAAFVGLGEEG